MPVTCEFESEVLAAVLESRWPDLVDPALQAHTAQCMICSDVVSVVASIQEAREDTREHAEVPDAARVWWRAQMRARREAIQAAGRPITAAQIVAFAAAVGLVGACFGATSTWFQSALGRITSLLSVPELQTLLPSATTVITEHTALVFVAAAVVLLVPAAVCVAVLRE